jgi:ABC-type nickel/cobalt efflux system permease component RcnA
MGPATSATAKPAQSGGSNNSIMFMPAFLFMRVMANVRAHGCANGDDADHRNCAHCHADHGRDHDHGCTPRGYPPAHAGRQTRQGRPDRDALLPGVPWQQT